MTPSSPFEEHVDPVVFVTDDTPPELRDASPAPVAAPLPWRSFARFVFRPRSASLPQPPRSPRMTHHGPAAPANWVTAAIMLLPIGLVAGSVAWLLWSTAAR